jgi:hypothetical protein
MPPNDESQISQGLLTGIAFLREPIVIDIPSQHTGLHQVACRYGSHVCICVFEASRQDDMYTRFATQQAPTDPHISLPSHEKATGLRNVELGLRVRLQGLRYASFGAMLSGSCSSSSLCVAGGCLARKYSQKSAGFGN